MQNVKIILYSHNHYYQYDNVNISINNLKHETIDTYIHIYVLYNLSVFKIKLTSW